MKSTTLLFQTTSCQSLEIFVYLVTSLGNFQNFKSLKALEEFIELPLFIKFRSQANLKHCPGFLKTWVKIQLHLAHMF